MRIESRVNCALPRLAWVADVGRHSGHVLLQHGQLVEVRDRFFIEGVWNGPFGAGGFGETDCVFGSGGIVAGRRIRFVSSAATTDYLYYRQSPTRVVVSNSLPLLLACLGDSLDPRFEGYSGLNESIMAGIDGYRPEIPTRDGVVRRLMYRNLDVSAGAVWESDKPMPPSFGTFEDYAGYLRESYGRIAANARDGDRARPLEVISTQSTGYDSTAVNAIAHKYGIDRVFTITKAKSNLHLAGHGARELPDDDGTDICRVLGLECVPIDRLSFLTEFDQESLYYCALHHNQDANLDGIVRSARAPALLLTGTLGEIWYTRQCSGERAFPDAGLKRWDLSGHGLSELRLAAGIVHVPIPYIGARRKEDILRITESDEMSPWRLGNAYDRPIPRRIAEEAGVPRAMFGQTKKGSVVIFPRPSVPHGRALRSQFFNYLAEKKVARRWTLRFWPCVRFVNSMLMLRSDARFRAIYYLERAISRFGRREFLFGLLWARLDGSLYAYCVNRRAARLSAGLLSAGPAIEMTGIAPEPHRETAPIGA